MLKKLRQDVEVISLFNHINQRNQRLVLISTKDLAQYVVDLVRAQLSVVRERLETRRPQQQ